MNNKIKNGEHQVIWGKLEELEKRVDRIDTRLWWVLGTIIVFGIMGRFF